jgi:hypothetical protein
MKRSLLIAAVAATLAAPLSASAAASDEMAEVKRMIEQMKADYEKKIEALEQRLKAAEQKAETAADTAETAKQASAAATAERKPFGKDALTSGTAFNPKLSIILDGNYYHDDEDGEGTELLSEAFRAGAGGHGHEEGGGTATNMGELITDLISVRRRSGSAPRWIPISMPPPPWRWTAMGTRSWKRPFFIPASCPLV